MARRTPFFKRPFARPLSLTVLCCVPIAFDTGLAHAQLAASPAADQEEIVVTARQRKESLQSVPEAITTFSADQIEDSRIEKFADFVALTPNFEFFQTGGPGVFQMSIRGISQAGGGGDAPIAMVVDGVTLPIANSFTMPVFDVESIQVLKGPQGALYGQNAVGGVVVINTKQPTQDFAGRLSGSYGKGNDNQFTGVFSGPLVNDKVLFRVAAFHHDFDGDVRHAFPPNEQVNYLRDSLVKADLKLLATDKLTFDLGSSYSRTFTGGNPLVIKTLSTGSHIPRVSTALLNSLIVLDQPNQDYTHRTRRSSLDGSFKINWDVGFADITSITAATKLREHNAQDLDVTEIPFAELTDQPIIVDAFSQELRITSRNDRRLRWIIGGFLEKVHRNMGQNVLANLSIITRGDINPADAVFVPLSVLYQNQHLDSYAGFAQINYDILPDLELTAAGRYDHDPRSQVTTTSAFNQQRAFDKFQPKASLSYKPTPHQTYYFTYAEGFRAGGFNAGSPASVAVRPVFEPEETTTYEAGMKFEFLEQRASLGISAYTTKYINQQLTLTQVTATGATQSIFTVKEDRVKGLELEAMARPAQGLELGLGVGLQDAKIKQFGGSLSGPTIDPAAYVGKYVPLQSKYTLNASAQYGRKFRGGFDWFIHADVSAKGRLYWYADNAYSRDPYNVVNAKLGIKSQKWLFDFYGLNIFNTSYDVIYFDNHFVGAPTGVNFAIQGDDVRYGAEFTYRF